jgi:hypothetical protein
MSSARSSTLTMMVWSVALGGCSAGGDLEVTVMSTVPLTALSVTAAIDQPARQVQRSLPLLAASGKVAQFAVALPDHAENVALTFAVTDATGASWSQSDTEAVSAGANRAVMLTLGRNLLDGGSPDAAADLSAGGSDGPMTPADDLASPADLAVDHDLAKPPFCSAGAVNTACKGQYLFCDGFDNGLATNWMTYTNGGATIATESAAVCRGGGALEIATSGGSERAGAIHTMSFPSTVYLRVWVEVPTSASWNTLSYADFLTLNASTNGDGLGLRFGPTSGTLIVNRTWAGETSAVAGLTPGAWHCVEAEIVLSTSSGSVQVWIDGSGPTMFGPFATLLSGDTMNELYVDIDTTNSSFNGATVTYFDEVAVESARIGCD